MQAEGGYLCARVIISWDMNSKFILFEFMKIGEIALHASLMQMLCLFLWRDDTA